MRWLTFYNVLAVLLAGTCGYILALVSLETGNMSSARLQLLPRLSNLSAQLSSSRSFWPTVQKPLAFLSSGFSPQHNTFNTTARMTHDKTIFKDAVELRRSIYQLTKKSTISDEKIKEIVTNALENVPSTFNSQSSRLVVLLHDDHDKFWDIVHDILKAIVPEDAWEHTGGRLAGFRGGYGTILFYEDPAVTAGLQQKMPAYSEKFPQWAEHTSAMHQYMLWTALETEGLGANLQHYNPLPNAKVSEIWKVPEAWDLKAQLVFGTPAEGARDSLPVKNQTPLEERLFVHGA